jgi:cyclase
MRRQRLRGKAQRQWIATGRTLPVRLVKGDAARLARWQRSLAMRRVSKHVYTEVYFWGCNPSFVVTSDGVVMIDTPQQPIDAVRWREGLLEHGPIRHLINTEPHADHISGNAYFPGVEVIGHTGIQARYAQDLRRWRGTPEQYLEKTRREDPDSVFLLDHPDYPPNPPTRTFSDELTLQVGNHTIKCLHIPGHTAPQTAVYLPDEGVILTGDNIFHRCKSFIQEADPWEWLEALERIGKFDFEVLVPGHGEPCQRDYLTRQAEIIGNWIELVEGFVDRGLTEAEALAQPLEVKRLDPYPIGQRLFPISAMVDQWNVSNIYKRVIARRAGKAA